MEQQPWWADLLTQALIGSGLLAALAAVFWKRVRACFNAARTMFSDQKQFREISSKVDEILIELRPNGGGSLRDSVNRIEDQVSYQNSARRTAMETSPVALVEADEHGNAIWTNTAHARLTGMSKHELLGNGWVNSIEASCRDRVEEAWNRAVAQERAFHDFVTYINATSGDCFVAEVTAHPIKTGNHKLRGYIAEIHPVETG